MISFAPSTSTLKRLALATFSIAVLASPTAIAAGDPAAERQIIMSHVGAATGAGAAIV